MTALLTHLEKSKRFPLLFLESAEGATAPVIINAQASRRLMALALACEPRELAATFTHRQLIPLLPWKSLRPRSTKP